MWNEIKLYTGTAWQNKILQLVECFQSLYGTQCVLCHTKTACKIANLSSYVDV